MSKTAFERDVEFLGKRLEQERSCSLESEARRLNIKLGYFMSEQILIESKIKRQEEKIARNVWLWWYQYNLAKRTMKKFKVRDIYKSPKALEYWRKYYQKTNEKFKGKKSIISDKFDNTNKQILVGLLQKMAVDDLNNRDKYIYVIERINGGLE